MRVKNVALMGGSFNPPHVGHLLAAYYVKATAGMDEVWWVPSHRHPFGKALVDFQHRLRMCEAMSGDARDWLKTSDVEQEVPGDGRTVDLLSFLVGRFPDVAFT